MRDDEHRVAITAARAKTAIRRLLALTGLSFLLRMNALETARLAWLTESRDVAVLYWPAEAEEAERLDSRGIPHLLLVDPGATPPASGSCLQEWLRLPADDLELRARLANLAKRAASHPRPPAIDGFGHLTHRGGSLFLSPIDQRLVQALVENFGGIVAESELIKTVWPDGAKNQVLRVHVSRLRQRLKPLGLTIKCARNTGYVMAEATTPASHVGAALLADRPRGEGEAELVGDGDRDQSLPERSSDRV
jgi:hypothetical protein